MFLRKKKYGGMPTGMWGRRIRSTVAHARFAVIFVGAVTALTACSSATTGGPTSTTSSQEAPSTQMSNTTSSGSSAQSSSGRPASSAGTAATASTGPLTKVSLRLNYIYDGSQAPFVYAKSLGYYADEGLDVTIGQGTGSAQTASLVGNGSDTFGLADAASTMLSAAKGQPLVTVATFQQATTYGIISRADDPIKSAKDLVGKTLAATAGDALTQIFPAVEKANDINPSEVKIINIDASAKPAALIQKRVDGILIGVGSAGAIESKGVKTYTLSFADLGVNTVALGIIANRSTVAQNPDLVRRFVAASVKGLQAALDNPQAAVDAGHEAFPALDPAVALAQLKIVQSLTFSPDGKGKPLGMNVPSDWQRTYDLLKEYRGMTTSQPVTAFYTNEFIPNS